jgi:hypothetical protein
MILNEALKQLEALGNEKVRARNTKNGADKQQFGVQMGDIRKVAAQVKTDHELGLASIASSPRCRMPTWQRSGR